MNANDSPDPAVAARRYHSLDSLRAAMMFLGIVIHATLPYIASMGLYLPFSDERAADDRYIFVLWIIHTFRMPIFFMMAGFFAALLRQRRGTLGLLANRFRRIVLPFVVGWVVLFPLDAGTGAYFRAGGGFAGFRAALSDLFAGRLYANPNTSYLWFLYYLAIFYTTAAGASLLLERFTPRVAGPMNRAFRWSMRTRLRVPIWTLLTALTLWPMASRGFDSPISFRPSPTILAAYGVFFGFGWLLYSDAASLPSFTRHAWKQLTLAALLLPVNLYATFTRGVGATNATTHLLAVVSGALIAWLFAFGLTGLSVRYLDRATPWIRYLTDASYWCYLTHYPVIYWVAALVAPLHLRSPFKVTLVVVLDAAVILTAYHFLARSTFLGGWLNGRRYPFRLPWIGEREAARAAAGSPHAGYTDATTGINA